MDTADIEAKLHQSRKWADDLMTECVVREDEIRELYAAMATILDRPLWKRMLFPREDRKTVLKAIEKFNELEIIRKC